MAILRADQFIQTAMGQAVAGAQLYVLTQPANVSALTPLATVYSDTAGTVTANPLTSDGFGHVAFYLQNTQLYTYVWTSPVTGTLVYPDQTVGSSVGNTIQVTSGVPSGTINGVNTVFTLPATPTVACFFFVNSNVLIPNVGFTVVGNVATLAVAPQSAAQAPPTGDLLYAIVLH